MASDESQPRSLSASGCVVRFVSVFFSYSLKAFSKISLKVEVSAVAVAVVVVEIVEDIRIVEGSSFVKKNRKLERVDSLRGDRGTHTQPKAAPGIVQLISALICV